MIQRKLKICVDCGDECYYWARKKCKSCCSKEVKPQKEKKVYVIPKQSEKLKAKTIEYLKVRAEYMNKHQKCEAGIVCNKLNFATDCHHKKGKIGELLVNSDFFLAVCRDCHSWIELHPIESKEKGFSLDRL